MSHNKKIEFGSSRQRLTELRFPMSLDKTSVTSLNSEDSQPRSCERVGGVQGALTLFCGGVAQTCHDDRVVELKEQLVVEEVDGEGQEGKVKEEGRSRVKENAPWMVW